tara:strand:+ start:172 stop:441 length:270 start_codon:yes stop_codon:yes gene_type:complete
MLKERLKRLPLRTLKRAVYFFTWLGGVGVVTVIAGQLVALPLFMGFYILIWGGYKLPVALIYAGGGLLFLYLMFEKLVAVMWYPSLLFS